MKYSLSTARERITSMLKLGLLLLLVSPSLLAQQAPDTSAYTKLASMSTSASGEMVIDAANPRPLEQAIRGLRRQFGWTIDYEDPKYSGMEIYKDKNSESQVRGGHFRATVPNQAASLGQEGKVLNSMVAQYNRQFSSPHFEVIPTGEGRFDVIPANRPAPSILETPVQIDPTTRTISEEIDEILKLVSENADTSIARAGMIDNLLDQTMVTIKHDQPIPARLLIEEALDAAKFKKVWLVGYEPSTDKFYLSTESTVKLIAMGDNRVAEQLVPQATTSSVAH